VALRYAVRISGVTALALTKLDVLSALDALKVCVGYRCGGQTSERFPDDAEDLVRVQPVLQEVEPLPPLPAGAVEDYDVLPEAARAYVQLIEQWTGVPVRWLSLGPGRDQTLERR
jgi:adenylosuccinate synthase